MLGEEEKEGQEEERIDKIFIIDHYFAQNQIDFIENC